MPKRTGNSWLFGALIAGIAVAAFAPAARNGFIWDDPQYVVENPTLRSLQGLARIWLEPSALPRYYPLVHTTYWLEYRLWGLYPPGYHLTNILLHAAAAVLLWRVLLLLNFPAAAAGLAAVIWAVHPLNLESVAWITERKNTLETVLYLASLLAYLRFDPPPAPGTIPGTVPGTTPVSSRWWYVWSLVFFAGAMLSKTVACSLPVTILILIWWKRGRPRARDWARLAPMFALGLALGVNTFFLERKLVGATGPAFALSPADRLLIASRALWFYAGKLIWPVNDIFIYPRWTADASSWLWWLAPAGVAAALGVLWASRAKIGKGPLAAVLIFIVTLFPALGFFNIYSMKYSFVADHFQYQAGAALIALAAAALARRRVLLVLACLCCVAFIAIDWGRLPVFKDQESLWQRTIEQNPTAWIAYNNLGGIRLEQGQSALASDRPDLAAARLNEAWQLLARAYELNPHDADGRDVRALTNLADMLIAQGKADDARRILERAVQLMPDEMPPRLALAEMALHQGKPEEAIVQYQAIVAAHPRDWYARTRLARLLFFNQRYAEASVVCDRATQLAPDDALWWSLSAEARKAMGDLPAAEAGYRRVVALRPDSAEAHNNLGVVLAKQNRLASAMDEFTRALRLKPGLQDARDNLEAVRKKLDATKPK